MVVKPTGRKFYKLQEGAERVHSGPDWISLRKAAEGTPPEAAEAKRERTDSPEKWEGCLGGS